MKNNRLRCVIFSQILILHSKSIEWNSIPLLIEENSSNILVKDVCLKNFTISNIKYSQPLSQHFLRTSWHWSKEDNNGVRGCTWFPGSWQHKENSNTESLFSLWRLDSAVMLHMRKIILQCTDSNTVLVNVNVLGHRYLKG